MLDVFVFFTENKFQHDGYDPADSDGDVLIEKEPLPSLGRFAVTLPVTFFDYTRNVSLLNKCKPFLIKVVDINKHRWYYKKQFQILANNIITNNTEVKRKESALDVDIEKVEFNMRSESIKPKIRPVDITAYADYNKVIKRNSSSQQIKHVKHDEKSCCMPESLGFKKVEYIDFKKNVGLVGLKISSTVDLNVSNAKVAKARSKDKREVQATAAKCGDCAKLQTTFTSDKIVNKTKLLLKFDQCNPKLSSTNKNPSDGNESVKGPSISLNDNKVNKEFNEKESANDIFFMNGYVNSNTEKNDKIKKAEKNPLLKEILTSSTSSPKSNILLGQHVKFDPGILTTKGELDKNAKLSFDSQKISKKLTDVYIKDNKKIKSTTQTVGKTKVQSEIKKKKKKAVNEKKDDGLGASKYSLGMNVALNKDNILKMVISKKPNTSLNVSQNVDTAWNIKNLTTGDQTSKTAEKMQESTCREELHNIYANIPTGKCTPNNDLLNNNNVFNSYQISSKKYPTLTNPSINPQVSQHNFIYRTPASENNQPSSFCGDNFGQSKNINAPIPKTNKPESHVISGAPSQISMHVNSNNGNNAVLVQNIATKDNSVIQRTSLPQVTAKHHNLPEIVQKKATSQGTNVQTANNVLDADKHTETKESRRVLAFTDSTTNVKQVNSKEPASRAYGMFDSKGNVINRMSNQEIYVRRAVFKSNVMNNIIENSKAINHDFAQVGSERHKTPDIIVFNHQSTSSPINHSEKHKIYVRRAVSKSNVHEEQSRIAVDQVPAQVVPQRRNTSESAIINHLSNHLISHSEHREIIARCQSDTTYSANIGNNSATTNKVNSKGYCNGPNSMPVMAQLAAHLNETRVPAQAQGECHGTNSNQKDISSFAQQRFPMTYTNNIVNFERNMNMNQLFNVNESHYNNAVPLYQPMPQQHVDYQPQQIQTCIGNRPIEGQNRPTRMQRSMMNMTSADQGLPYPHTMQNAVPMNTVHCAPVYNSLRRDMNLHSDGSYYNSNQSNALWSYLYPPPPPPPPVHTTGTFFPPTATAPPQPTFIPSSVTNSSSIIGCNNSGIIRKINIVAVPVTDKEKPSNNSSEFSNSVDNPGDKPANSKLEMLEELSKVIMDIPPDSPVKEKNPPVYPLTKPDFSIADFSNRSHQSINVNTQSESIPTTDKLKVGTLNSTNMVKSAPHQNAPLTLAMSEHNIPKQAKSNVSSSKLCSPIKRQSTQTTASPPKKTASPPKNVTGGSCTEISTEKHNTTLASSPSPQIQNFKRLHSTTEAQDKCPEMRKILSNNPRVRPGPLSKKPKLSLFQKPSSPKRDPRGKLVLSAADTGYSPPILPILTYEKTLEYIAHAHPETRNAAEKDDFTPNEDKLPVSILRNGISKSNCNKRKLDEVKRTTQDKSVKKISLDEYKKRVGKNSEKDVNNITIKLECKTEKLDDTKQGSDLDLGYDSDSTMIL